MDKPPLEGGEITAEEVLRDTAPRNMSRDASRERKSPQDEPQKILMLDSSPGSSRKVTEGEEDTAVHVHNFSKEISLDSEEDFLEKLTPSDILPDNIRVEEAKVTLSPKGILKRKHPPKVTQLPVDESPRNSKCCHPIVEKIKHIADKTIHHKKDTSKKSKPEEEKLEIIALDCSPGAERRERKKAAELEKELDNQQEKTISLVMSSEDLMKKDHVYEDMLVDGEKKVNDGDTKSGDSKDPSLLIDESMDDEESVQESVTNVKSMYDTAMTVSSQKDSDEDEDKGVVLEVDDVVADPSKGKRDTGKGSPNLTITDITDEDQLVHDDKKVHFQVGDEMTNSTPPKNSSDDEGVEDFWSKIGYVSIVVSLLLPAKRAILGYCYLHA